MGELPAGAIHFQRQSQSTRCHRLRRASLVPSRPGNPKIDIAISPIQVLHRVDGGNLWEPRNRQVADFLPVNFPDSV